MTMSLSNFPVHPQVPVADIGVAADFYEQRLGLPLIRSGPSAHIDGGSRAYGAGGQTLLVYETTVSPSQATVAMWLVDDLATTVRELTARGVAFVRYNGLEHDTDGIIARAGGGHIAWFQDPDGNTFAVESED